MIQGLTKIDCAVAAMKSAARLISCKNCANWVDCGDFPDYGLCHHVGNERTESNFLCSKHELALSPLEDPVDATLKYTADRDFQFSQRVKLLQMLDRIRMVKGQEWLDSFTEW